MKLIKKQNVGASIIDSLANLSVIGIFQTVEDKFEAIKSNIRSHYEESAQKYRFFHPFSTDRPLSEHLKDMRDTFEKRMRKSR